MARRPSPDERGAPPLGALPPVWPSGLTDQSPLPFSLWRVLHQVDGVRTAEEIARLAGVTAADVTAAVAQATVWVRRSQAQVQSLTPEQTQVVLNGLTQVLGPMAEFAIEDALEELGEQIPLGTFLSRLASPLTEIQRQTFAQLLRARHLL
ncbi:hypothetical protein SAMN00790413_04163 [Deinococcus hopiensis KR-140]|uniref:DUF8082 domain-containing protein n=1 Tax=Deinococcus hopiensis KR-140 TaxID=695939 RepID=A0A1W1UQ72_9DEIO|nr:hypothetical protein SAMN00790413_04163 [Deinococcus hopiensis KR-140]